jgi:outer membrane translocation and assembly module TamA
VAHLNNQVRLWNNIYVTLRANLGKIDDDFPALITLKDFRIGYGVSVQYNSVVGPLGFTLSSSNVTRSLLGAFHLGFWF